MAYIPYIISNPEERAPEAESNVQSFPRLTLAMEKLRRIRRNLKRCEDSIANDDPNSACLKERVRAGCSVSMLPVWQDDLKKAEAELALLEAGDTLSFGGRTYQAVRSPAGAN
jgi:hypothetical protein